MVSGLENARVRGGFAELFHKVKMADSGLVTRLDHNSRSSR